MDLDYTPHAVLGYSLPPRIDIQIDRPLLDVKVRLDVNLLKSLLAN